AASLEPMVSRIEGGSSNDASSVACNPSHDKIESTFHRPAEIIVCHEWSGIFLGGGPLLFGFVAERVGFLFLGFRRSLRLASSVVAPSSRKPPSSSRGADAFSLLSGTIADGGLLFLVSFGPVL